jgi:hypothetical protein
MAMLLTLWDNGLQAMCRDHPTPRCRIETPATILERSFVYGEWRVESGEWRVESGEWSMEYGVLRTEYAYRSMLLRATHGTELYGAALCIYSLTTRSSYSSPD